MDKPIMKRSTAEICHRDRSLFGWAALAAILAVCQPTARSAAQVPKQSLTSAVEETRASNVRDDAGLFSAAAIANARKELRDSETKTRVPTIIATVETLSGRPIEEEAPRMAKQSGIEGIFVLISKKERKLQVMVSHRYLGEIMKQQRDVIRTNFTSGFREGVFDVGLAHGVRAIGTALVLAQRAGEIPVESAIEGHSAAGGDTASLVLRNQVRLSLPGARVIIAAAQQKARALNLKVNIAVVDDGGHLIAFERMDGARPASGYTAITKATSAATFRQNSGPIPPGAPGPDPLLNLSLQLAASASGGKLTSLLGGVTVLVDGQVIGAIGVGGGTGEQDTQIATAGVAALIEKVGAEKPGSAKGVENVK
jgi:glc operon protein GlcG